VRVDYLLPNEGELESRQQCPRTVLRALALSVCNEGDVHAGDLRVRVDVDLELREIAHGWGWKADRDDAGHAGWRLHVRGAGREDEAFPVAEAGKDELDERAEELVHLRAGDDDLRADGRAAAYPPGTVLAGVGDLDALLRVAAAALERLARERAEDHDRDEEVLPARDGLLVVDVEDDLLELDDILRLRHRRGLLPDLGAADGQVRPVLRVRVRGVVLEPDLPRRRARAGLMEVGHVHEVVRERVVVVLRQPARVRVANDELLDMRDGHAPLVEPETLLQ
jgi:hypothetical protein